MTARRWLFNVTAMACLVAGGVSVEGLAATTPLPFEPRNDPATDTPPLDIAPGARLLEQPISGNPLWGVPLRTLNVTRERPIFVPSRRPPAPAVMAVPYTSPTALVKSKTVEPERPGLSLVGIVTGSGDSFAVFINAATHDAVRLKTGEGHEGWFLVSAQGREVVLEKDRRTAVFGLPPPRGDQK